MAAENYDISIVQGLDVAPLAKIDNPKRTLVVYGRDTADLVRAAFEAGRQAVPWQMVPILPDGPCE